MPLAPPTDDILTIEDAGVKYSIRDPGGIIGRVLRTGAPYESPVLEHIRELAPEGTALDVGAHVGNHTLWFAIACGMRVVAFEPLEFDRLRRNVDLNLDQIPPGIVHCIPCALGRSIGRAEVVGKGQLSMNPEGGIAVCAIDELMYRDVGLVKIDVEGMESQVLLGGLETIKRDKPLIFAEAHTEMEATTLRGILEPLGYEHVNTWGATPLLEFTC